MLGSCCSNAFPGWLPDTACPGSRPTPIRRFWAPGRPIQKSLASQGGLRWWTLLLSVLALGSFAAAMGALVHAVVSRSDIGSRAIAAGMLASAAAIGAGFLVNRNIFNSDNYRYLVLLLVPWSIGLGLVLQRASQRSLAGQRGGPGLRDRPGGSVHLRRSGVVSSIGLDRRSAHARPPPA